MTFSRFRVILGVKAAEDRNSSLEPSMVAFEFKTKFISSGINVTTNWKTDTGWQNEQTIDSDWIDLTGRVNLKISFENSAIILTDNGNSVITKFDLQFELDRINRLQVYGNIKEMQEVSLKYNSKLRRSPRRKSNSN